MQEGTPSRTAWAAAVHRAAHQVLEDGRVFSDPFALRILGLSAENIKREEESRRARSRMRLFIAARTRFAEDALASAVALGFNQLVILGAGLDTFAYRNPFGDRLHIFEVDHPATQAWKRGLLEAAVIGIPESLSFAPIDFERQTLGEGLAAAGLDSRQPTFFTWLGVVPYLNEDAIWSTLGFIASLPNGAQVVFDYSNPPETLPPAQRADHDIRAARVAELGEALVTYFEADTLHSGLAALGFKHIQDMGPSEIRVRCFSNRTRTASDKGGHILRAASV